jgi:hypothetical protein
MSPSTNGKSSITSIEHAPTATEAAAPPIVEAATPASPQNRPTWPMDDITVTSACELLNQCRNKKLVVAYGMAEKTVEFLQDVVHTWIFWLKAHIRITQQPPSPLADSPTSPAAMPGRQDQLPHSPASRAERSMSHVGDMDPSKSPPPSPPSTHVKGKGK